MQLFQCFAINYYFLFEDNIIELNSRIEFIYVTKQKSMSIEHTLLLIHKLIPFRSNLAYIKLVDMPFIWVKLISTKTSKTFNIRLRLLLHMHSIQLFNAESPKSSSSTSVPTTVILPFSTRTLLLSLVRLPLNLHQISPRDSRQLSSYKLYDRK